MGNKLKDSLLLLNKGFADKRRAREISAQQRLSALKPLVSWTPELYILNQPSKRNKFGRSEGAYSVRPTDQTKSTSLQRKGWPSFISNIKQNHNGNTTYQANPITDYFSNSAVPPTRVQGIHFGTALRNERYAIIQSKYRAQPMVWLWELAVWRYIDLVCILQHCTMNKAIEL